MIQAGTRRIHRSTWHSQGEIQELIQAVFAAELLSPSLTVWVVSPWVSDLPIIDNRTGSFNNLGADWGQQQVRLGAVLQRLLDLGSNIQLATRPTPHNARFLDRLVGLATHNGIDHRLTVHEVEDLHEKGILGDSFYLSGSMNLTYNGVELLEEMVTFETSPNVIADTKLAYHARWGGKLQEETGTIEGG